MSSRRRPHLLAWAVIFLALALAWTLCGFFAAPGILRSLATDLVRDRMHRELSLGAIRVDPLRLEITIEALRLPDADGGTMLGLRTARLRLGLLRSLALRAPVLASAEIDGLQLRGTIGADRHLNLADLALLQGPDDSDARPARYVVERLVIDGESVQLTRLDGPRPFTLQLAQLKLEARELGTAGTRAGAVELLVRSDAGESLEARGHLQLAPLRADASLGLRGLRSSTLLGAFGDALPMSVDGGTLDLEGQVGVAAGEGPLQVTGQLAKLELADLGLRALGGGEDLVRIRRVTATEGRFDLARHEASLARLAIDGVTTQAVRDAAGHLNLAALAPTTTTTSETTGPAWRWQLPEVALSGGSVTLEDRGTKPAARVVLRDIALTLHGLSQDSSQPLDVAIDLRDADSGRLSSQGRLRPDTLAYQGRVEGRDIDLRPMQPYLQQAADLSLLSGKFGLTLDVTVSPERTRLRGEAEVRALRTVDNALKQDFLQWKRVLARKVEFDTAPRPRLRIRELLADAPYARVVVGADRSLNLSHVLRHAEAVQAAPAPPLDIRIDVLRVNNASANFSDLWIQPQFAVGIQDLGGTIRGLSSQDGTRATVDLQGAVDRYAPVTISGEINPLSAALFSDISVSFRNMDLTSVTPYSGRFAGYEIRKGKLSVDLEYHIKSRKLDAKHHLIVDQLELGDPVDSPEATSLPVRLAIALLKDRHGVIDVQLPVSGNLDDPKFRLGPLVWKMAANLVVKVVTAPFALLGNLFGGGEDLNQVTFIPGTAQLDALGRQRVAGLRKAMVERPGLRLDLPAAWSAEIDRPAMLRRQLEAQLADVAPQVGPDRYRQLVAAWQEEAGKAPLPGKTEADIEAALLARYVVGDGELEDLGRRRAMAIQDMLFESRDIDPVRVFVVDGKPAAADAQSLRVDLLLK